MSELKKEKIIFGLVVVVLLGAVFNSWIIIQLQKVEDDLSLVNYFISNQQTELITVRQEITQLQKVNKEDLALLEKKLLIEQAERISAEKEQIAEKVLAQQQLLNLEEKIAENEKNGLAEIINQWGPYVVSLECSFYRPGTEDLFLQSSGSGLLTEWENSSITILTNKHIITALSISQDDLANECLIRFPQEDFSITSKDFSVLTDDFDWGIITINFPTAYIKKLVQTSPQLCIADPILGDGVAILGYPSIGDQKNITVTEGIIAGFDEDYFITSAKVEKGNSGGAAVSLKNNCYLGTPTFSTKGEIESLARILDVKILLK